jgi:hypothetical protein
MLGVGGFVVVTRPTGRGTLPTVDSTTSHAFAAIATFSLANGGDNIALFDAAANQYIQAKYGSAETASDVPVDFSGFPSSTATLLGDVLDFGSFTPGVSLALFPDGVVSNVVVHNSIGTGGTLATPGAPNVDASSPPVYIAEYVEGSSFNKALKLCNPSGQAISLNGYTIEIAANAATDFGTIISLNGKTIAAGGAFVVADDGAVQAILDVADLTPTNSFWNGDDAIAVRNADGVIIDSLGKAGLRNKWGENKTLRRKPGTPNDVDPTDDFPTDTSASYCTFPVNTFDGLGTPCGTTFACPP